MVHWLLRTVLFVVRSHRCNGLSYSLCICDVREHPSPYYQLPCLIFWDSLSMHYSENFFLSSIEGALLRKGCVAIFTTVWAVSFISTFALIGAIIQSMPCQPAYWAAKHGSAVFCWMAEFPAVPALPGLREIFFYIYFLKSNADFVR